MFQHVSPCCTGRFVKTKSEIMPPTGSKAPQKLPCLNKGCKKRIGEYHSLVYVCSDKCGKAVEEFCAESPEAQSLLELYSEDAKNWDKQKDAAVRQDILSSHADFQKMWTESIVVSRSKLRIEREQRKAAFQLKLAEKKKSVHQEALAVATEVKSKKRTYRDAPDVGGSLGLSLSQEQDDGPS